MKLSHLTIAALLLTVPGFAQNTIKPIRMPQLTTKGHYYAPKAARIEMPKPAGVKPFIASLQSRKDAAHLFQVNTRGALGP